MTNVYDILICKKVVDQFSDLIQTTYMLYADNDSFLYNSGSVLYDFIKQYFNEYILDIVKNKNKIEVSSCWEHNYVDFDYNVNKNADTVYFLISIIKNDIEIHNHDQLSIRIKVNRSDISNEQMFKITDRIALFLESLKKEYEVQFGEEVSNCINLEYISFDYN